MSDQLHISIAGNVLASALAELGAMGFHVTPGPDNDGAHTLRAESAEIVVTAYDTLQLLGLAVLASRRGPTATRPTDAEIDHLLSLEP